MIEEVVGDVMMMTETTVVKKDDDCESIICPFYDSFLFINDEQSDFSDTDSDYYYDSNGDIIKN